MSTPLKSLLLIDSEEDLLLVIYELQRGDYDLSYRQVTTLESMQKALEKQKWDIIICDNKLPAIEALSLSHKHDDSIPFIIISGILNDELIVAALKSGANDYILKNNIKRLLPAVKKELQESQFKKEYKKAEEQFQESEERFYQAFEHGRIGMALIRIDGHFMQVNDSFCEMLGYNKHELMETNHSELIYEKDAGTLLHALDEVLSKKIEFSKIKIRYINKKNQVLWGAVTISLVSDANNIPLYYIFQIENISSKKFIEDQLYYLARNDALTGFSNITLLEDKINQAIIKAKDNNYYIAVMQIDLDRFRQVNNALGLDVGDFFLQIVEKRLRKVFSTKETIARVGSDEFIVLISNIQKMEKIVTLAENVLLTFEQPFVSKGDEAVVTVSMGISVYPKDGEDSSALLKNANTALIRAKERGGNCHQLFNETLPVKIKNKMSLINRLRQAVLQNEFVIHYQPIVDILTENIVSMEALVRWQPKDEEIIPPMQFIPIAEETGFIIPIGNFVLHEACKQIKAWQKQGYPITVSVNLSEKQISEDNFQDFVMHVLQENDLDPSSLELEITENMIANTLENNNLSLDKLKKRGVKISVDDFGTGYSVLNYLRNFNPYKFKIDKSFIKLIPGDEDSCAICRTIIAMAHSLGIKVVAEGVENKEQLEFLKKHRCDEFQGYFFSKPFDAAEITIFLQQNRQL